MLRVSRHIGRSVALAVLVVAVVATAVVLLGGSGSEYRVIARFENASQLVRGNEVQVAGAAVGLVDTITLTDDGQADVALKITDPDYAPLRQGTQAVVRLTSLSGVANRYVDLQLPGGPRRAIADGGRIAATQTTSAVDLDQLLDMLDQRTQADLQGVIQGFGREYDGRSAQAARGYLYLNPSLAASSRLFEELTRDTPALTEFVTASSSLVGDVAAKRDDLAGLVDELADFTGAVAAKRTDLADALERLPPFMRRADTTFVNLRAAVDDLRPLVRESKPVTPKLRALLAELRPFARDARPTVAALSNIVRRSGAGNDLIELTRAQPALRAIATAPATRNGKERRGAFPETVDALRTSTPELAFARPYAVDLTGWFDDFGHSGLYDALGGKSRVGTYLSAFAQIDGVLKPVPVPLRNPASERVIASGQRNRCPGAAEHAAPDRSNPWKPSADFNCDPSQVLPGR